MNEYELSNVLIKGKKAHDAPNDHLSVVEINSDYLEMVDRWYAHKGHSLLYAIPLLALLLFVIILFFTATLEKNEIEAWYFFSGMTVFILPFLYFGIRLFLLEGFKKTYYPIRFDRKKQEVYAILPSDDFLKISWHDLNIHVAENKQSVTLSSFYEVRGFILDNETGVIKQSITLGYPAWGEYDDAVSLWEFIRIYMEEKNGYEKCSEIVKVCMPIKERKESLRFSIIRGMALLAPNYALQFLSSPITVLFIWCRILSIKTSQLPVWPEWVNLQHKDIVRDEYSKQSKDNTENNFWEETWPVICFVVGSLISLALILWAGYKYWLMYQ
ncbi:DUF6708 domain-containing protein [Cobetia marina]|uniref:DUF6708 domain-containing protein n=1 Tax=Cobetia marina TaxID=28258 RepID=UPI003857A3D2